MQTLLLFYFYNMLKFEKGESLIIRELTCIYFAYKSIDKKAFCIDQACN